MMPPTVAILGTGRIHEQVLAVVWQTGSAAGVAAQFEFRSPGGNRRRAARFLAGVIADLEPAR